MPLDLVLSAPRSFAEPLFEDILERCHTVQESEAADCRTWSCDCWIKAFASEAGIDLRPLRLAFEITRIRGSESWYTPQSFKVFNRKIRNTVVGRNAPILTMGHKPVARLN